MIESFIKQLGQELGIEEQIKQTDPGQFRISLDDVDVTAFQSPTGNYVFKGNIANCPQQNTDELLLKLMESNLLARGTRGASIGLTEDGNLLTLTMEVDYNNTYKEWRDKLEDFITVIDFWKKEVVSLK